MNYVGLFDSYKDKSNKKDSSHYVKVGVNAKIFSNKPGLFIPSKKLQQKVESGEAVGSIYSIIEPEREPETVYAKDTGVALSMLDRGMIERGELLMIIAQVE